MVETMMEAITIIQPICLKYLSIKDCSSTISFPNDQLHASLRTLNISGLNKLKFSCDTNTNYWKHFQYIISLPITYYDNMETLLVLGSESYKSLIHFRIGYCPNFVSIIPREGLFVPNLTRFIVHDYDKLKSLPDQMGILFRKLEILAYPTAQKLSGFLKGPCHLTCGQFESEIVRNYVAAKRGYQWTWLPLSIFEGPCDGINSFLNEDCCLLHYISWFLEHLNSGDVGLQGPSPSQLYKNCTLKILKTQRILWEKGFLSL